MIEARTPLNLFPACSETSTAPSESIPPSINSRPGSRIVFLLLLLRPMTSVIRNLLLQHNTVNTRLKQRKHKACLALEVAQPVEDLGARVRGQAVEEVGELLWCQSTCFRLP